MQSFDVSFPISIGGLSFDLRMPEGPIRETVKERYSAFEVEHSDFPALLDPAGDERLEDEIFRFSIRGTTLVLGRERALFYGAESKFRVDTLLRLALGIRLLDVPGVLIHASTVVNNGRAFTFMGRSGAGKSTVARLSVPRPIFTDEISMIQVQGDQGVAFGTPFWGEFQLGGRNESAPSAGLYELVQASEDRVERLGKAEALRALLPNVLFFAREPHLRQRLLEAAKRVVETVPVHRLYFRRDARFWEVL